MERYLKKVSMRLLDTSTLFLFVIGGDVWESNPPRTALCRPPHGFEARGAHQDTFVSEGQTVLYLISSDLKTEALKSPFPSDGLVR